MLDIEGEEILIGQSVVKSPFKPRAIYLVIGEKDQGNVVLKRVMNKEGFPYSNSRTRIIASVKDASIKIISTLPEPRNVNGQTIKIEIKTLKDLKKDKQKYSKYIVSELELLSNMIDKDLSIDGEINGIDLAKRKKDLDRKWNLLEQYLGVKVKLIS